MLKKDFIELYKKMEEKEHEIMWTKGKEYTQSDQETDMFANFHRTAKDLGLDPKQVCWIFLRKHLDSIVSYIKDGKEHSDEKIEGRITDARNYLAILNGIIQEQKKEK